LTYYAPGTKVTVTEGIVPGTKVSSISTDGIAETTVPGSTSIAARTTTVIVGTPVTSTAVAPSNEAVVTFADTNADPGVLKVCALVPSGVVPPTVAAFPFTVTYGSSVTSLSVPTGNCAVAGSYPYNSQVTVVETLPAGQALSGTPATAITTEPLFVTERDGGADVSTGEPVLVSASATATSATPIVMISEDQTTDVNFNDTDPPFVTVIPDPVVTGGSPVVVTPTITSSGVSTSTVTSGNNNSNNSGSTGNSVAPIVAAAVAPTTPLSVTKVVAPLTKAQKAALLKKDERSLSNVKAAITRENKLLKGHLTTAARKADVKRLSQLKSEMNLLNREIRSL
jgi:hypothetical protein